MRNCPSEHILITVVLAFLLWPSLWLDAVPDVTVIEGATIIDGIADAPVKDAVIVIEGNRIRSVGRRGSVQVPASANKVDLSGKTIIPGIVNLHAHLARTEGMETNDAYFTRERIERDAKAHLYYGVTQVLSLGEDREAMSAYLADQTAGKTIGARVYSAGLGFAAKGGWPLTPHVHRPATPEEARAMAKQELSKNPIVTKIWVDNRLGKLPNFPPDIYGPILEEAHKQHIRVAAHVYYLDDAKELMRRGVALLAHAVQDREVDDEFIRLARQNRVTQVATLVNIRRNLDYAEGARFLDDPNLALLFPASVLSTLASAEYRKNLSETFDATVAHRAYEVAAKNVKKIADAGIPVTVGSDTGTPGSFPGFWELREMELLVGAGLSPMQVIQAATSNGARFLRVDTQYGSITPGKVADFIVLNADPLSDITNVQNIAGVWMKGKPVNRAALAPVK